MQKNQTKKTQNKTQEHTSKLMQEKINNMTHLDHDSHGIQRLKMVRCAFDEAWTALIALPCIVIIAQSVSMASNWKSHAKLFQTHQEQFWAHSLSRLMFKCLPYMRSTNSKLKILGLTAALFLNRIYSRKISSHQSTFIWVSLINDGFTYRYN